MSSHLAVQRVVVSLQYPTSVRTSSPALLGRWSQGRLSDITVKTYSLPKSAILSSRSDLQTLFSSGQTLFVYPLKLVWVVSDDHHEVKCAFSVPKRLYRRAVSRNRIKRLMREAYRLQRPSLLDNLQEHKGGLHLMVIYLGKQEESQAKIHKAMTRLLSQIPEKVTPRQTS
ncbi:MAG: ribonuclease P protein component [Bacteroidota bacterium]